MKKLIIATAVVVFFTACHSTSTKEVTTTDSTKVTVDSIKAIDSSKVK